MFSKAFAAELDAMGVVNDAIEDGIGLLRLIKSAKVVLGPVFG